MNIDNKRGIYTVCETSPNPSNDQGNRFKKWKSLCIQCLTLSLAFWLMVLVIAIGAIIPVTQLIVGILHENNCPMNHLIPIYLIVAGVIGLFLIIISIMLSSLSDAITCFYLRFVLGLFILVLGLFQFLWLIAGHVWVYRANSIVQFHNPNKTSTYCNKTVFDCAYGTLVLSSLCIAIACCSQCMQKQS